MPGISTDGLGSNGTIYGGEMFAGDTYLPNGATPQTQAYSIAQLAGGLAHIDTVVTGATLTLASTISNEIVTAAGGIANLAIILPGTAPDNMELTVLPQIAVTTLAVTSSANSSGGTVTVSNAPTAATAGTRLVFVYKGGTWYKG